VKSDGRGEAKSNTVLRGVREAVPPGHRRAVPPGHRCAMPPGHRRRRHMNRRMQGPLLFRALPSHRRCPCPRSRPPPPSPLPSPPTFWPLAMASARVVSKHNEHRMRRFKQRRRRSALGAPRRCPGGTALRTPLRTVLLFPSPLPPVFISLKASQCSARGIHGRGNGYWLNYKRVAVHAPKSRAHARRLCGTRRKK
jgi:hypothetical protein